MLHRAPKVVLMSDPRVGDVPVQDCGEDLVHTRGAIIATECENGDCWYTSSRWVRSSVRDRLVYAAQLLPSTYTLALDEGWRPPAVQARVFDRQVSRLADVYPNEPLESLRRLASRFVRLAARCRAASHRCSRRRGLPGRRRDRGGHGLSHQHQPRGERRVLLHRPPRRTRRRPGCARRAGRGDAAGRLCELSDRVVALVLRRPLLGDGHRRVSRPLPPRRRTTECGRAGVRGGAATNPADT